MTGGSCIELYGHRRGHGPRIGLPWAMATDRTGPLPVSPLTARKTWRTVEPIHSMLYFAPEAPASYARLGISPESGYFISRSAPMGAVRDTTVIATFYNFRPSMVQRGHGRRLGGGLPRSRWWRLASTRPTPRCGACSVTRSPPPR